MDSSALDILTSAHPTFNDFPPGTRILWQCHDTGPEKDGVITQWGFNHRSVLIVSSLNKDDKSYVEVADVFVNAILSPDGKTFVSIRKEYDNPKNPTQDNHPTGTVMVVKLRVDGRLTGNTKVRILQYVTSFRVDETDQIQLEIFADPSVKEPMTGVYAWHSVGDVYIEYIIPGGKTELTPHPNPQDHPVGSRIRWAEVGNVKDAPRDSDIMAWKDGILTLRECLTTIDRLISADRVELKAVISVPKPQLAEHLAGTFAPAPAVESTFFEAVKKVKELGEQLGYKITISLE